MSNLVTLRTACAADESFLRALFAEGGQHYELLGPDVREILLDMDYRGHRRDQLAAHPDVERFVVSVDGVDVGALALDCRADVVEIVELVVARRYRRRGIGSAVLGNVPAGPKAITLRARDVAGRGLCTRLGFVEAEHTRTRVTLRAAA